jgi:hypothetical protein
MRCWGVESFTDDHQRRKEDLFAKVKNQIACHLPPQVRANIAFAVPDALAPAGASTCINPWPLVF